MILRGKRDIPPKQAFKLAFTDIQGKAGSIAMFFEMLANIASKLLWFALHISDNNNFPKPLSAKEEAELFAKLANGDKSAKDKLILHNMRLVAHIVKKYYVSGEEQDELISIGTVGLIKAVGTFKAEKGNRFAAYGSRCIENEILMHFRALKKTAQDVHFDEPIDTDKDGNQLTLKDIIAVDGDICEEVERSLGARRLYSLIETKLDEREKLIIVLRYGLYSKKPLTQREAASLLGISRSYVSRIEKRAIDKLADEMKDDEDDDEEDDKDDKDNKDGKKNKNDKGSKDIKGG
jgi:RNA polymerase sporulation-specific sigma factor